MLFYEALIELFDIDIGFKKILDLTDCSEEIWHFFNFNTDSRISLCVRAHYLKYVKGTHQGHRIAFLEF